MTPPQKAPRPRLSIRYDTDLDGEKYAPLAATLAELAGLCVDLDEAKENLNLEAELAVKVRPDPTELRAQLLRIAAAVVQSLVAVEKKAATGG